MARMLDHVDGEALRQATLALREKVAGSAGVLCTVDEGKVSLIAFAGDRAVREFGIDAGKLVRDAARNVQGGGGGKPEFATAGGKNPEGIEKALEEFVAAVREKVSAV